MSSSSRYVPSRPARALSLGGGLLLASLGLSGAGCRTHAGERVEVGPDNGCYVCHQAQYEATTNPAHVGLFGTSCESCHLTDAWVPAVVVDHEWFELRNRHAELRCTACHTVGYRPGDTPDECVGCHRAQYDGATDPPHAGFPTDCATCHTDAGWRPSTFEHRWPLDGAHAALPCASCHTGDPPTWAGIPSECVGCHRADYDSSPFPGHGSFPTTCGDCHTTTAWRPAIAGGHPEARFPIARGPHARGYACIDCHDPTRGSSAGGENTNCVGCHDGVHTRARMDREHDEVWSYPRGTTSVNFCLDCHPSGLEGGEGD